MMIRYLLLILFILLVIWATRALRGRSGRSDAGESGSSSRQRRASGKGAEEDRLMLRCAHCGVHLPRDEALPGKGGVFCCEDHRAIVEARLGDRDGDA